MLAVGLCVVKEGAPMKKAPKRFTAPVYRTVCCLACRQLYWYKAVLLLS